jgi:hypothetical protein
MPRISRFHGIVVMMFYEDHGPAHFHARHGELRIKVWLSDGRMEGRFPARQRRRLLERYRRHRFELWHNWRRVQRGRPPRPIAAPE